MKQKPREETMRQWDKIRKMIIDYPGASAPRDAFESIIDNYEERIAELESIAGGYVFEYEHGGIINIHAYYKSFKELLKQQ